MPDAPLNKGGIVLRGITIASAANDGVAVQVTGYLESQLWPAHDANVASPPYGPTSEAASQQMCVMHLVVAPLQLLPPASPRDNFGTDAVRWAR